MALKASNSQIRSMVVQKTLLCTRNDVIGYFRSATNGVNATGTTADFSVRKYDFLDYLGNWRSLQLQNLPSRNSLYITGENDATSYFRSAANRKITQMFIIFAALAGFVW